MGLDQMDSLAAMLAWQTLRGRLPETPMGLLFFKKEHHLWEPGCPFWQPVQLVWFSGRCWRRGED